MLSDQPPILSSFCRSLDYPSGWRRLFLLIFLVATLFFLLLGVSGCSLNLSKNPVLFLGWDANEAAQLYRYEDGKESRQLTDFAGGVGDFAASPDGHQIVLSINRDSGGSELWIMENDGSLQKQLYTCSQAECSNFSWAPDSRRLLFERRESGSKGLAGTPSLWWLDTNTAEVHTLYEDERRHGANGRLSPDGQWLSHHSPEQEGLSIYNLEDGRTHFITNEIGTAAAWNPDSQQLVVPQMDLVILHGGEGDDHEAHEHDYQSAVHLLYLDVNTGEQQVISGDIRGEDSVPVWSPDGQWLALGRRLPGAGAARQLWIMRPDGSEARAVTHDPAANHGPPAWSADGRYLLYQQIPQDDLASEPGIWRVDVKTGAKEQLVPSGMQPTWLPPTG